MLTALLANYQSYLIKIAVCIAICLGLWFWHISEIRDAEENKDAWWVEHIKNSPVKSDTVVSKKYILRKDTSGIAAAVSLVDSAKQAQIDSLLKSSVDKDSLIAALATTKSGTIADSSFGKLIITYDPLFRPAVFRWQLVERPPIVETIVTINNEKLVPLPFRRLSLNTTVNSVGQVHVGAGYRLDNWLMGFGYQVLGPGASITTWREKLQLNASYFIF
jgi:hypothetical protein